MTKFQEDRIYKIFTKIKEDPELKKQFNENLRALHNDEERYAMLLNAYEAYEHAYILAKKQIKKKKNERV
jgi:hypothetical protein